MLHLRLRLFLFFDAADTAGIIVGLTPLKEGLFKMSSSKRFAFPAVLLPTLLSLASTLQAQGRIARGAIGGWQNLGSAHVDGRADHDKISVGGGTFTTLQMGVSNGAIGFERIVVHFRNGGDEVLPVAVRVASGGRTPAIPLRGGAREISSVEIWYVKGRYAEGKPTVQLFGRR